MQRVRGEHWLLAPSSCPGLSITTSQILHLTCTISVPCSSAAALFTDEQHNPHFPCKAPGQPWLWGHTWRPPTGTENALLCTFCITWQGGRADSQSHSGCPSPCAPGGQHITSPVPHSPCPWLAAANPPGVGEQSSHSTRDGKEGDAFGLPPLMARSTVCRWDPCAICGELVSPPTALHPPEDGLRWHMMCHCPGSWCVQVCLPSSALSVRSGIRL